MAKKPMLPPEQVAANKKLGEQLIKAQIDKTFLVSTVRSWTTKVLDSRQGKWQFKMRPIPVGTPLDLVNYYLGKSGDLILVFQGNNGWDHIECELSKCSAGLTGWDTFVERVRKFGTETESIIAAEQAQQRVQDYANNPIFGSW
jgi:hypothetical protein